MTLDHYLKHRRRYEVIIALAVTVFVTATLATSEILENLRAGLPGDWSGAWARELSSGVSVLVLLPLIAWMLDRLDLNLANLHRRIGWLLLGFVLFSLLHIGLFTALRVALWAGIGESYRVDDPGWVLLYEMRKDLLTYVALVAGLSGYRFILNRLQGEARFLAAEPDLPETPAGREERYRSRFLVKMLNREYLVRVEEIDWMESAGNYVLLHCGARTYPMRSTMHGLAQELNPRDFMRVHRTAIVNLHRLAALDEGEDLRARLVSGDRIPVSRTYLPELKKYLTDLPVADGQVHQGV